jgi:hypothetical protein
MQFSTAQGKPPEKQVNSSPVVGVEAADISLNDIQVRAITPAHVERSFLDYASVETTLVERW